jgi:DNA replication protein DnaC
MPTFWWVTSHENIFVLGPTGVGKSFVACASAQKACRDGHSALYLRAPALFRDLAIGRADGSLRSFLAKLSRVEVLVIDDWAMAPLAETERRNSGRSARTATSPVLRFLLPNCR